MSCHSSNVCSRLYHVAVVTDIVKGMETRMTKETDGIESDGKERGRKEQCSDK